MNLSKSDFLRSRGFAILCYFVISACFSNPTAWSSDVYSPKYLEAKALYDGRGVSQDRKAALQLFIQGSDEGDLNCAAAVGFLYDSGLAGEKNPELAVAYLSKAASGGITKAQYNLAMILRRTPGKREEAMDWLRKASEGGFEPAQLQLGEIYFFGDERTPRDYAAARPHLEKADAQGNAQASHLLGQLYQDGLGVSQDPGKARFYLTKAARKGHAKAQAILGIMLATGKDVPKDRTQGLFWLTLSTEQGEALGENALKELQMAADKETLAEVKERVEKWRKKLALSDTQ